MAIADTHLIKTSANRFHQRSIHLLLANPVARCAPQGSGESGYPQPPPRRLPTLPPNTPMSSPHVTPNRFHVVFPRYLPTTSMSSSRATSNHSHVVFPRYPPATHMPSSHVTPNRSNVVSLRCRPPPPCRLATLPPTTPMSSPNVTSRPIPWHPNPPTPCRPRTTRRRYLIDTGGTLHGSMRPTP